MGLVEQLPLAEQQLASEFDVTDFRADQALTIIDRLIADVYLPFRGQTGYGTERAILVEPSHIPHRENDAEHSWHLGMTAQVLWDNREELNLEFPADYDPLKALQLAQVHDIIEIWAPDVDAVTPHADQVSTKKALEWAAQKVMRTHAPYLSHVAELWEEYEHKASPEAQFITDLDKIISTRLICHDGGQKWQYWEGYSTSREHMCGVMRSKLRTAAGHAIFDALERDLDQHPEYFPTVGEMQLQGILF